MKIQCDVCFSRNSAKLYSNVPMIFTTEQTGGACCKPYISYSTMGVCPECRKTLEAQYNQLKSIQDLRYIVASGAMGSNSIHMSKIFHSFRIDPKTEIFTEASSSPERWHPTESYAQEIWQKQTPTTTVDDEYDDYDDDDYDDYDYVDEDDYNDYMYVYGAYGDDDDDEYAEYEAMIKG